MSPEGPPPPPPPPPPRGRGPLGPGRNPQDPAGGPSPAGGGRPLGNSRWIIGGLVAIGVIVLLLALTQDSDSGESLTYSKFLTQVNAGKVADATYDNNSGKITGHFIDE